MTDIEIAMLAKAIAGELVRDLRAANVALAPAVAEIPPLTLETTGVYHVGPLTVDLGRHEATLHGKPLTLKAREFALLAVLARHPDQVFTRDRLLALAWPADRAENIDSDRTVDVHVRRVRERLGAAAQLLRTVHGVGYKAVPVGDPRATT